MTELPAWNRLEEADRLYRYVQVGRAAAFLPGLPGRDAAATMDALERCRTLYREFAARRIVYDDEPLAPAAGWQIIRDPATVLGPPSRANCIDLTVAFAGACLDTGLHPLITLVDPISGLQGHALVLVCLGAPWTRVGGSPAYRRFQPDTSVPPAGWPGGLCASADGDGAFLPLDISLVARHSLDEAEVSFAEAVETGYALLTSPAWRFTSTVDVGLRFHPSAAYKSEDARPQGIRTHREAMRNLRGLRKNLLSEHVEFVPPEDESVPDHPANVLRLLEHGTAKNGVVLVGAAGLGKTRTCYEAASAAAERGWKVWHVAYEQEPGVSTDELATVLRGETAEKVLVVLDDINECQNIQIGVIHSSLVPEFSEQGIRLRVLASCRSGALDIADPGIQQLLEVIPLDPAVQQRLRVRDQLIRSLAPKAVEVLGIEGMRRACGTRPVIAMLIATEAERLADDGALTVDVGSIRSGDLVTWLSHRLQQDGVLPLPPGNIVIADQSADPRLKLCAAEFAAAPQHEADVLEAGRRLAGASGEDVESVLHGLRKSGWLIEQNDSLVSAHDLVTDQVLRAVLFEPSGRLAAATVTQLLDTCLGRSRTVGRFAVSLARVYEDLEDKGQRAALAAACADWLAANADGVGQLMAATQSEGATALGSILNNPVWTAPAEAKWNSIAAPWLLAFGRSYAAMHLFGGGAAFAGLTGGRSDADRIAWLAQNPTSPFAPFALIPLLASGGDDEKSAEVRQCALTWLSHNASDPAVVFVLRGLVSCGAAESDPSAEVTDRIADWLTLNGASFEAIYILAPLLNRRLDQALLDRLTPALTVWLDRYQLHSEASNVLGPLLAAPPSSFAYDIPAMATRWIEFHGVGYNKVTKYLSRRPITEVLAVQILEWVIDHPGHDDCWWRLTRVAKGIRKWPHLLDKLLTAIEAVMWSLSRRKSRPNAHGEVDGVLQILARKVLTGVEAARLDAVLVNWVIRPEAFAEHCPPGSYYPELIRRVCSLCVVGRFDQATVLDLLTRMRAWIARWDCSSDEDQRRDASCYLESISALFEPDGAPALLAVTGD